jgi:hypothetical protein
VTRQRRPWRWQRAHASPPGRARRPRCDEGSRPHGATRDETAHVHITRAAPHRGLGRCMHRGNYSRDDQRRTCVWFAGADPNHFLNVSDVVSLVTVPSVEAHSQVPYTFWSNFPSEGNAVHTLIRTHSFCSLTKVLYYIVTVQIFFPTTAIYQDSYFFHTLAWHLSELSRSYISRCPPCYSFC